MAEAILSSVADKILGQLHNLAVKEISLLCGVEDALEQLKDTISTIKSVLTDAEKKQAKEQQIKTWLRRLEDVVYEADDLVDEFSTEVLRRRVMTGSKTAIEVRIFFSTENQLVFRHKKGKKIRDIRKKLDAIAKDKADFHLVTGLQESKVEIGEWEEHSFEREENVIGRDDDKQEIIRRLFDMKTEKNIVVVPIVGVGGVGKTTLAQLVSSDVKVKDHFELIIWVNVPKVFDVKLIGKQIVESGAKEKGSSGNISMDQSQKVLREKIKGKQYLIVLDDVWDSENENICEKWSRLENLLRDGANGSRIIVTTRSQKVARIINGSQETAYFLKTLSEEKSWSLFKKLAFLQGQEPDDLNLVEIGQEIMKSCGGIPLVIRAIASMLFSMDKNEWFSFKERELLEIPQYENDIISRLKLSYDNLPSHLKHCFAYCSLFPKNHIIHVQHLINLWMAQGFIQLSNKHQHPEDIGYQYFKVLLYKSFFEIVQIDDCSEDITHCKMHDCMHDLAMSVVGAKCIMLNSNDGNDNKIDPKTHHVSFNYDVRPQPALLTEAKRIRTILLPNNNSTFYYLLMRQGIFDTSTNKIDLSSKFLRTLELYGENMEMISNSIGMLKHLRYLNLSYNKKVKALPDCITSLLNLQTLLLISCGNLRTLPRDITKLVNLRHLDIQDCDGLSHMPRGISQMTNLQTLTQFSIKEKLADSGQLNELENLNGLRGHLEIVVGVDGIESKGANLKNKQYLQSLELNIGGRMVDECEDLLPHPNLKELYLKGLYVSDVLLNCAPSLHNLVKFQLREHEGCRYVGALNHLPNLKELNLEFLHSLEYISSDDDIADGTTPFFPSLQRLWLENLPNLKGWWSADGDVENKKMLHFFPRLSDLWISECPNLISMPLFPNLREELYLCETNINPPEETLKMKMNVEGGGGATSESDQPSSSTSYSSSALVSHSTSFIPLSKLKALHIEACSHVHCLAVGFKTSLLSRS
ncbi:putative disease resistance protein RGA3 isoform X1 [Ziziphus jujuba]|uniref:Disease resistance protein RGA3 isoform X1 n=1 Tax=Ziziphus jujuba TaxID=326968 RepID=A0ABM3IIN1_ZIZJJ|nr:putative disease resistance protein RGA3 isoform X1 [Ziziphus jujuba]XP_048329228.2 putative disease resistance protein RGA3 isoform X1 [Ziziphus jujuba]XP_048329229.2 putative disease resistance protein RGA3 isoform X1 [Ziziphus jujuba]XP_048329230.2 putative disease resistance protein RGA3 isoform X1 [Ziziphus jujuba]XP_048329231.2 putative disease resistance protein RGA3 isoform X1 [Ziziphus jujuba]XP_048329232.2 putative disease resistance protein RGA3 isoform X1 [Ziziphus jujuba]XP_04